MPGFLSGQNFYRFKADVTIKNKSDSSANLVKGQIYYDKFEKSVLYNCSFPRKEITFIKDSTTYYIRDNKVISSFRTSLPVDLTVFSLSLNGKLNNFGLENTVFKAISIEKDSDLVITTWEPEERLRKHMGKVLTSIKDNKLYGVVIYNGENVLIGKQFFSDYVNVKGIEFPTEVLYIIYNKNGRESYQITNYKNIVLNDTSEDHFYTYRLPGQ